MEDNLSEIIDIFSRTTDKREMRSLFEDVFTDAERTDIAKRWYIFKEIYKGTPQRKIAKDMEVSLCKITRGSKTLKNDQSVIKRVLSELYDETHI
ncbi:MAG: transcriptional regulator [Spirochaetales bacterium]|nr:transcriptional regulator [Spirochaetales bacterium]MBO6049581.1 transcriptional regulator [Spirochaetales bacterium]